MKNTVISVEHLSKQYDLGVIGTGTISRDLNRWWARLRGKPDPYSIVGQQEHYDPRGKTILALDAISFTVQQGKTLGIIAGVRDNVKQTDGGMIHFFWELVSRTIKKMRIIRGIIYASKTRSS